jgi:hypothetical protein
MEHASAGLEAGAFSDKFRYERHRPERTLLYQLVEQYYPELADLMTVQGSPLPRYVRREFEEYLKCGRLEHGFLRLRCDTCHGVYVEDNKYESATRFQWIKSPTNEELARLTHTIAKRIGRYLERQGLLERDAEHSHLNANTLEDEQNPMHQLHGSSVTYRIAVGPRQGRKVFTLQTMPASDPEEWVGKVDGFSLHAGVAAKAHERKKLERLCRYVARPPVSEQRLSRTRNGMVRYQLKTPYRDGTTHVIFEPLDFIAKLAALVPKPRVNLTRFHGVFAPNSKHRSRVTPGKRGKGKTFKATGDSQGGTPEERKASMTWAQRLKRVFGIDVETCDQCGGAVKTIACIEDPVVIKKILDHLDSKAAASKQKRLPQSRAPP